MFRQVVLNILYPLIRFPNLDLSGRVN